MKTSEFKLKVLTGLNNMVDTYFGSNTMTDKFLNSTIKVMIKQKSYMLNDAVNLFANEHDEIDEHVILEEYTKMFKDDKIIIDLRDFVGNNFVKGLLPDKALVLRVDDIINMLK